MKKTHEPIEQLNIQDDVLVISFSTDLFSRIGEIRSIDAPEEGLEVEKGEEFSSITGTEDDLHLRAPLSGVILEVNELFSENLTENKHNPGHREWFVKIEPQDVDDLVEFEE